MAAARSRRTRRNPRVPRTVQEVIDAMDKKSLDSADAARLFNEAKELEKAGDRANALDLAYAARIAEDITGKAEWFTKVRGDYGYHLNAAKRKAPSDPKGAKQHQNVVDTWNRRFRLAMERGVLPKGTFDIARGPVAAIPATEPSEEELAALVGDLEAEEPSAEDLAGLVESVQEEQAVAPPPEVPAPPPAPEEPIVPPVSVETAPPPPTPFTPKATGGGLDRARLKLADLIERAGLFQPQPYQPLNPARSLDDILKIIAEGAGGIIGQDAIIRAAVNALRSADFFFAGPAGSGKSSIAQRLSQAMLNRPSLFVSVDPSWFPTDLTASLRPDAFIDPENAIQVGHALVAMLRGQWLVLDEATRADMGIYYAPMMLLRSLGHFTIPLITERPIYAPNWFRVVATANLGDEGTYRRPDAIKDRFAVEYVSYPAAEVEIELMLRETKGGLRAVPAVDGEDTTALCRKLVAFASLTRGPESGFNKGISTRGLIGIGRFITNGMSVPVVGGGTLYPPNEAGQAFCLADAVYSFITDSVASEGRKADLERFLEMWEGSELGSAHPNATRLLKTYIEVQLGKAQPVSLDIKAKTPDKVFGERRD